ALGEIGAHDSRLRLQEPRPSLRYGDGPPPSHLLRTQQLGVGAGRLEHVTGALGRVRDNLEQAGELEHCRTRLRLELAPAAQRRLCQPDVLELRVGEPEDARASVTRASVVPDAELLEHR